MTPPHVFLALVSFIPLLAGLSRLFDLSTGLLLLEGAARFGADPLPAVLHIVGATAFATLGALQFVPALRRGPWHRYLGRGLAAGGVVAALAGAWMMWSWPRKEWEGLSLDVLRVAVAVAIITFIIAAVVAVRRGDVASHRAWMTRAWALWAAGGTQAFTLSPFLIDAMAPWRSEGLHTALFALGWLINLLVAEWALRLPSTVRVAS
jgi:uncharacterized membrane protein